MESALKSFKFSNHPLLFTPSRGHKSGALPAPNYNVLRPMTRYKP